MSELAIGIDPDTTNCGLGLVGHIQGIPYVRAVAVASVPSRLKMEERLPRMTFALIDAVNSLLVPSPRHADIIVPVLAAIEWQSIRPREKTRPNDMMNLVGVSGMCAQVVANLVARDWQKRPFKLLLPLPGQWKPTIPKPIYHNRLRGYLALDNQLRQKGILDATWRPVPGSEGMTKAQRGHVMDGIGLAWWALQKAVPGLRRRG